MEFTRFEGAVADWAVDVLAVGVTSSNDWSATPVVAELNKALSGVLSDAATAEGFEGKPGQSFVIHTHGRIAAKQVLLLGSTGDDWSGRSVAGRTSQSHLTTADESPIASSIA